VANHYQRINVEAARDLIGKGDLLLLDVRVEVSYGKSHIEGAQRADKTNIMSFLNETPKDKPVLIYCYHGNSSQVFAKAFISANFANVYSMDGGYEDWAKAQPPVQQTAEALASVPVRGLSPALAEFLKAQGFPEGGVHVQDAQGMTPLMRACYMGPPALVEELLSLGARVDVLNNDQSQALWLACVGDDPEIVGMIIKAGADLNHANVNGSTAMMYAASGGKTKALAKLLDAGADLDIQVDGFTALDMASTLEGLNLMREAKRQRVKSIAGN
jgi:rhodanese-related sulfurtransferase